MSFQKNPIFKSSISDTNLHTFQVEKEGAEYQNKLIELRDQMSETTKQMNAMTGEYVAMKESAQHYDSLMNGNIIICLLY